MSGLVHPARCTNYTFLRKTTTDRVLQHLVSYLAKILVVNEDQLAGAQRVQLGNLSCCFSELSACLCIYSPAGSRGGTAHCQISIKALK
ncbi:hypothetical protein G9P44_001409 [Scheffersomyces stipitis]|nr:hypothetical protein G9P44_001409 [Scheffersomyces stipitis]